MYDYFERMWKYTDWADGKVLTFFGETHAVPERCRAFMAHIAAAQQEWLSRLTEAMDKPYAIWPDWSGEKLAAESERARAGWLTFAASTAEADLALSCAYKNLSGDTFHTDLGDIMMHVINHSTHHRAQIASAARAEGLEPPATDFIYFVRENA